MTPTPGGWREAGGPDVIDRALESQRRPGRAWRWLRPLRTRAALGLAPAAAPALLFVPIGMLLGPRALNVLSPIVLAYLDTVVSIALAVLGVFVGLALDVRGERDRRLLAAGAVEAIITVALVAVTFWYLLSGWSMSLGLPPLLVGLALGVSAAASSAVAFEGISDATQDVAARIADLDDVLPIVLGGLIVVLVAADPPMSVRTGAWHTLMTLALGSGIGVAGWLLFERAHSQAERNVFIAGILALLGGTAAYLGLSPLLSGMAAGLLWTLLPGSADHVIREDLRKIQHPLIVLLLLVAGASCAYSLAAVWLCAPLVLFRLAGKLAGGWVASRMQHAVTPADLGAYLVAPGLLGIAFALNVRQVLDAPGATALLTAVVVATLASEALAFVLTPEEEQAPS
jgi:hypothetical protein